MKIFENNTRKVVFQMFILNTSFKQEIITTLAKFEILNKNKT
jgi:hypothetical protein